MSDDISKLIELVKNVDVLVVPEEQKAVYLEAIRKLGEMKSLEALDILIGEVNRIVRFQQHLDHKFNYTYGMPLIEALGKIGDRTAVPVLIKAIESSSWQLAIMAGEALSQIEITDAEFGIIEKQIIEDSWRGYTESENAVKVFTRLNDIRTLPALIELAMCGTVRKYKPAEAISDAIQHLAIKYGRKYFLEKAREAIMKYLEKKGGPKRRVTPEIEKRAGRLYNGIVKELRQMTPKMHDGTLSDGKPRIPKRRKKTFRIRRGLNG